MSDEADNQMRQQYRELSDDEKANLADIKGIGTAFFKAVESLEKRNGQKREWSLAKTKIEEAVMWATKGITG